MKQKYFLIFQIKFKLKINKNKVGHDNEYKKVSEHRKFSTMKTHEFPLFSFDMKARKKKFIFCF